VASAALMKARRAASNSKNEWQFRMRFFVWLVFRDSHSSRSPREKSGGNFSHHVRRVKRRLRPMRPYLAGPEGV
jgi:hypothetical protein